MQECSGQNEIAVSKSNKNEVHFMNNIDSAIMREIASITVNNFSKLEHDTLTKPKLIEIPLKKCTDSSAFFEKGNLYTSEIIVNICSENSRIKEIIYLHYKLGLILPDSVINDINISRLRDNQCKVFRSEDKKRIYIYILNSDLKNNYEVIWIIKDDKYYTRAVNYLSLG